MGILYNKTTALGITKNLNLTAGTIQTDLIDEIQPELDRYIAAIANMDDQQIVTKAEKLRLRFSELHSGVGLDHPEIEVDLVEINKRISALLAGQH